MGASASTLIDDLHTSAQMADELAADRKVKALKSVQELGKDPLTAVQIIEQGGIQPLLLCYNATHPVVRVEAAKALAILAQQPNNQLEMGMDDLLPHYHPALLTASHDFCEHAMALMAELAKPDVNRMKIAHEGLLGPIMQSITVPNQGVQLHALAALGRLCEKPQIAVLMTQRGVLGALLRAARSSEASVKLGVMRVLSGIADCGENMRAFIYSGALIFLMGCTFCGHELQLATAKCLEGLLRQVYEGTGEITEKEANMLSVMSAIEISPERLSDDDLMHLDMREATEMPIEELLPELVSRARRLVNCDRASVFIRSEDGSQLKTILAEGSEQITVPADPHSIAGQCVVQGHVINLRSAYQAENFNSAIDKKTGYTTRSMIAVPIRRLALNDKKSDVGAENDDEAGDTAAPVYSNEPAIGVIQCINKLGRSHGHGGGASADDVDEDGHFVFSQEDVRKLEAFTRNITPVLEKTAYKKRPPRKQNELGSDWIRNLETLAPLDIHTIVRVALDRMRTIVMADRASLFIHDRRRKQLWSKVADDLAEIRVPSNAGIVGAVCTSGEPLNIADAYKDDRFNRRIDIATGYRTRTILCVPIKNQRAEVVGVVQCINKKSGVAFTHEDLSNLDEFCWQISGILEAKSAGTDGVGNVASGDASGLLLHLLQEEVPEIQLHAASCIGYLSRNEGNRTRIVALGGVPVLLALGMPWPWRSVELLKGVARSMGNLSISPTVRREVAHRGGWKSLLALAQTTYKEVWFDALRALANLALFEPAGDERHVLVQEHEDANVVLQLGSHIAGDTVVGKPIGLARQMLDAGALETALTFLTRKPPELDLRLQAVRLCGNLAVCCRDGADASATHAFSRPSLMKLIGEAAVQAGDEASSVGGAAADGLTDFAAAYAKLSSVPAIALWLFDATGVTVLEAFAAATTGAMADDMRVHLGSILANCLRQRHNQRIVLDMLRSHDPTDPTFAAKSTSEQRLLNLKDRDALKMGKEIRGLMTRLLRGGPYATPHVWNQYARVLQMLAAEPSNHSYMLQRHDVNSYVEQLVFLAGPAQDDGDTRATALRGLRLLADLPAERQVDGILRILSSQMRIVPVLMAAALTEHEDTRVEVCRLVRALAAQPDVADQMVASSHLIPPKQAQPPRAEQQQQQQQQQQNGQMIATGEGAAARDISDSQPTKLSFLTIMGDLLAVPSSRLQMEVCLALEPLASKH